MIEKVCPTCGEMFAYPAGKKQSYCPHCRKVYRRDYYQRRLADGREHAQRRAYRERYRAARLRRTYGIDGAEYDALLAAQNGACAICHRPERARGKGGVVRDLAVDHRHTTGAVRGLLCGACNAGLAHFGDDAQRLRNALDYLTR